MGALLSQAVADQLRQFPGSQDPRPSPPTLIQQVLNQPGASLPMWMAPVMENQQLMTTGMDPNLSPEYRQAIQQAMARDALKTVMAFGGADITKEQRLQWEKENEAYRLQQAGKDLPGESIEPGTRVYVRPENAQEFAKYYQQGGKGIPGGVPGGHGVVVKPGTPEAGKFGHLNFPYDRIKLSPTEPPSPEHVAVRSEDSPWWFWRHRSNLEVLPPPEEFPTGTQVEYRSRHEPTTREEGVVTAPPRGARSPGPDYVWVDIHTRDPLDPRSGARTFPRGESGVRHYKSGDWGAWIHRSDLGKKK